MDNKPEHEDNNRESEASKANDTPANDNAAKGDEPETLEEAMKGMDTETDSEGQGPITPPEDHFQATQTESQPSQQSAGKGKKPLLISAAVVVLLALVGLGGYAAYAHVYMPERALEQYLDRSTDYDSGEFVMQVDVDGVAGDDQLGAGEFEFAWQTEGAYERQSDDEYAFMTDTELSIGEGMFAFDLDLELGFVDERVYMRTNALDLLGGFTAEIGETPAIDGDSWYHIDIDELEDEEWQEEFDEFGFDGSFEKGVASVIGEECSQDDQQALQAYLEDEALDRLDIQDVNREDWFGTERNDKRAAHYTGRVELKPVVQAWAEDFVDVTSDECLSDEDIDTEEAMEDIVIEYDLYKGRDWDEVVLTAYDREDDDQTITIGLETKNYDQDVDVSAPEESQSLLDVLADLESAFEDEFGAAPADPEPLPDDELQEFDEFEQDFEELEELEQEFEQEFETQ